MISVFKYFLNKLSGCFLDIAPIMGIIIFFQLVVIQKPFPDVEQTLFGVALVVVGLFVFIIGLENALFPIGEQMAVQFAKKGKRFLAGAFWFCFGILHHNRRTCIDCDRHQGWNYGRRFRRV